VVQHKNTVQQRPYKAEDFGLLDKPTAEYVKGLLTIEPELGTHLWLAEVRSGRSTVYDVYVQATSESMYLETMEPQDSYYDGAVEFGIVPHECIDYEEMQYEEMLQTVDGLLTERLVAYRAYNGSLCVRKGLTKSEAIERTMLRDTNRGIGRILWPWQQRKVVPLLYKFYSWHGTHDCEKMIDGI
jgi:hypothetical protein